MLSAGGLVGLAVGLSAPPALIVAIGIKGVSSIAALSGIVAATGAVSLAGGTAAAVVSSVKKQNSTKLLESELESERKSFSDYAQDSLNPEKTRVRFEQLRKNNPSLGDIIDKCIIQMDKMDSFQSRQQSLLDANEAVYLLDTVEVIRESERRMCRNFRNKNN